VKVQNRPYSGPAYIDSGPASSLRQKGLQIATELRKWRAADDSSV